MLLTAKPDQIKQRRVALNLSKTKLSQKAGLANNAVLRIENGCGKVHPLRAKALAEALGCDVADIFVISQKGA